MSGRGHVSNGIDVEHDALIAVGAGKFPTARGATAQGYSVGLTQDTNNPVVIEPSTATVYPADVGEAIVVASDNAADTTNLVRINGLDEHFKVKEEIVQLDGLSPVALPGLWSRINSIRVLATAIVGTVAVTGPSGLLSYATARDQQSTIARYSCPVGSTLQVLLLTGSMLKDGGGANVAAVIGVYLRTEGSPFVREFGFAIERRQSIEFINTLPAAARAATKPVDIELRGYCDGANVDVFARCGLLEQDI